MGISSGLSPFSSWNLPHLHCLLLLLSDISLITCSQGPMISFFLQSRARPEIHKDRGLAPRSLRKCQACGENLPHLCYFSSVVWVWAVLLSFCFLKLLTPGFFLACSFILLTPFFVLIFYFERLILCLACAWPFAWILQWPLILTYPCLLSLRLYFC